MTQLRGAPTELDPRLRISRSFVEWFLGVWISLEPAALYGVVS